MTNEKETKRRSKFLSLILRHQPEIAHLTLGPGGWVNVDDLLKGLAKAGRPMTREQLFETVETNAKQRFSLSTDQNQIRAAQGHSVSIENDLLPVVPPEILYHGTSEKTVPKIMTEGLVPMQRLHVHLSSDVATARKVGARHGRPAILVVSSKRLQDAGQAFFRADNGVWLTGPVSPDYLTIAEEKA